MNDIKFVRLNDNYPLPAKENLDEESNEPYDIHFINFILQRLNDFERSIIQLYFFAQRSDEQIGRILTTDFNTVGYVRRKTLQKIRVMFEIYSKLTPTTAVCPELPDDERKILLDMYTSLKRPAYHAKIKSIIIKIEDIEKRKIYNLIYNYTSMFYNGQERKTKEVYSG